MRMLPALGAALCAHASCPGSRPVCACSLPWEPPRGLMLPPPIALLFVFFLFAVCIGSHQFDYDPYSCDFHFSYLGIYEVYVYAFDEFGGTSLPFFFPKMRFSNYSYSSLRPILVHIVL